MKFRDIHPVQFDLGPDAALPESVPIAVRALRNPHVYVRSMAMDGREESDEVWFGLGKGGVVRGAGNRTRDIKWDVEVCT